MATSKLLFDILHPGLLESAGVIGNQPIPGAHPHRPVFGVILSYLVQPGLVCAQNEPAA